jgi:hypothetical protein
VTGQAAWFDLRVAIRPVARAGDVDDDHAAAVGGVAGASAPQLPPLAYAEADERPLRYGARFRNETHRSQAAPEAPRRKERP